jgi:uncharacterized membrane protein
MSNESFFLFLTSLVTIFAILIGLWFSRVKSRSSTNRRLILFSVVVFALMTSLSWFVGAYVFDIGSKFSGIIRLTDHLSRLLGNAAVAALLWSLLTGFLTYLCSRLILRVWIRNRA